MTLSSVTKQDEGARSIWRGVMPVDRVRKAIVDAITSELGLGPEPPDVTVDVFTPCVADDVAFRVVRDLDHWRKRLEAQGERAAYESSNGG